MQYGELQGLAWVLWTGVVSCKARSEGNGVRYAYRDGRNMICVPDGDHAVFSFQLFVYRCSRRFTTGSDTHTSPTPWGAWCNLYDVLHGRSSRPSNPHSKRYTYCMSDRYMEKRDIELKSNHSQSASAFKNGGPGNMHQPRAVLVLVKAFRSVEESLDQHATPFLRFLHAVNHPIVNVTQLH